MFLPLLSVGELLIRLNMSARGRCGSPSRCLQQERELAHHTEVSGEGDPTVAQWQYDRRWLQEGSTIVQVDHGSCALNTGRAPPQPLAEQLLVEQGVQLITRLRKNMRNRLVTLSDKLLLLRKRAIIETIYDQLKNICETLAYPSSQSTQLLGQPGLRPHRLLPSAQEAIAAHGSNPGRIGPSGRLTYPELTLLSKGAVPRRWHGSGTPHLARGGASCVSYVPSRRTNMYIHASCPKKSEGPISPVLPVG